jgi:hypothetical protein
MDLQGLKLEIVDVNVTSDVLVNKQDNLKV